MSDSGDNVDENDGIENVLIRRLGRNTMLSEPDENLREPVARLSGLNSAVLVLHLVLACGSCLTVTCGSAVAQSQSWVAQGPGPNTRGQTENIAGSEVIGAIRAVAPHPVDTNIVYVGAVNGGVWKTTTAMAASPTWEHQTDYQDSLSIGALEFDPTDASHQTLVAGSGRFSSLSEYGGALTGLLRTTNGGARWNVIADGGALAGLNVSGIAARGKVITISANEADNPQNVGIWRSTNTGASWNKISGASGTGLPDGASSCLVGDASKPYQFFTNAGALGLYRSNDAGATWVKVSDAKMDSFISQADNIKISVGARSGIYVVYVAVDVGGHLAGIFRSVSSGDSWTAMDLPETPEGGIHPGGQGGIHLSIAADPFDASIVYIGGDRQPAKFIDGQESYDPPQWPNSIGAMDYSGRLFRGNASKPAGSQWVHLTHSDGRGGIGAGTAHGSAPHADSRGMAVAVNGVLIEVDDGGIYRRTSPQTNTGDWFSMNGDIQVTEFHAVAWDANCHIVVGGAQDTGTPEQQVRSGAIWESISKGDGGVVAVDASSTPGRSIRYSSYYGLGSFRRQVYNSSNVLQSESYPPLRILNSVASLEPQFYTPLRLNEVAPSRLVIGAKNAVYESLDQGDTLREIGRGITTNGTGPNPIAYGAKGNPDILYVGSGNQVFVRNKAYPNSLQASVGYSGDMVLGIAIDPNNGDTAYLVSPSGVYKTTNAGGSWAEITGDIGTLGPGTLHSVAYSGADPSGAVFIGADRGIFIARGASFSNWKRLGTGLPNAPVYHVEYSATDGVVLAGTLGRGAWVLRLTLEDGAPKPAGNPGVVKADGGSRSIGEARHARDLPQSASQIMDSPAAVSKGPFELSIGVIVDPAEGRIYVMDLEHGIEAVDLATGKNIWTTKTAAKPIGWAAGRLIAQAERPDAPNRLTIVAINPTTGGQIVTSGIGLPGNVSASVTESLKGDFKAVAKSVGEDALVSWQFIKRGPQALPPGTRSALRPPGGIGPGAVSGGTETGTYRMNLTTGAVSPMNPGELPPGSQPRAQEHVAPEQLRIADGQSLSPDGRYILISMRTSDDNEVEKYTLTVYDRKSKARLGEFKSHESLVPFLVWRSLVICESGPYIQRTSDTVREQPRKIRGIDLKTGKDIWSVAIRDAKYRGPFPP